MEKKNAVSPRVNAEPFTFYFNKNTKAVLSAYCNLSEDKTDNMGNMLNELADKWMREHKNIKLIRKNDEIISANVDGPKGNMTIEFKNE